MLASFFDARCSSSLALVALVAIESVQFPVQAIAGRGYGALEPLDGDHEHLILVHPSIQLSAECVDLCVFEANGCF